MPESRDDTGDEEDPTRVKGGLRPSLKEENESLTSQLWWREVGCAPVQKSGALERVFRRRHGEVHGVPSGKRRPLGQKGHVRGDWSEDGFS